MGVKMELFSPTLGLYPNGLATGVVELLARLFSAARTCLCRLTFGVSSRILSSRRIPAPVAFGDQKGNVPAGV